MSEVPLPCLAGAEPGAGVGVEPCPGDEDLDCTWPDAACVARLKNAVNGPAPGDCARAAFLELCALLWFEQSNSDLELDAFGAASIGSPVGIVVAMKVRAFLTSIHFWRALNSCSTSIARCVSDNSLLPLEPPVVPYCGSGWRILCVDWTSLQSPMASSRWRGYLNSFSADGPGQPHTTTCGVLPALTAAISSQSTHGRSSTERDIIRM